MRKPSCERYTLAQNHFFFLLNECPTHKHTSMARHIFLQLSIFKIIQLCTFAVLMCFPKPSTSGVCGDKTFIMSTLYNNLEPVELPTKRLNDFSRTTCSTKGAGCSSEVERSLMVRWVVGSIFHGVDPLSYFSFQPVVHDWCNKVRGMCYSVWDGAYKRTLAVNRQEYSGSGFPFSLSEWSLTTCLTPYNRRYN